MTLDLFNKYATPDEACSAPRNSAARQLDRFNKWESKFTVFARSNTPLDCDEICFLVVEQLSVIRTNLEFAALHDTDFPDKLGVLSSPEETPRRESIQKLEGTLPEALHAVEATIDRLEELGEAIRQQLAPNHESQAEDLTETGIEGNDFTSAERIRQPDLCVGIDFGTTYTGMQTPRPELPKNFALKASQSDGFQALKHKHMLGSKGCDQSGGKYFIKVAGVKESYSHQGLEINKGLLYFTRLQLEVRFNTILKELEGLIEEALARFEGKNRLEGIFRRVNYVVLSGSLGSSDYVLEKLTKYFNGLENQENSCVAGTKVFRAEGDTRTFVAKGLLYDRGTALGEHIARANYGIIVEGPRPEESDPSKNTKTDQIHWLVKFGDTIQVGKPITLNITKRLEKSNQRKWTGKIVWLCGGRLFLPENVEDGWECGMKELHSVDIEVRQGTNPSSGTQHWWRSATYHDCNFKLILVVGPSGDCDVEVSENALALWRGCDGLQWLSYVDAFRNLVSSVARDLYFGW